MKKITSLLVCLLFCLSLNAGAQTLTRPEFIGKSSDVIGGPTASHIMIETTATANGKRWLWQVAGGHLKGQVTKDDGSSPVSWVDILRSGDAITSVSFPQINFTGNVQHVSGGYFNWGTTAGSSGYGIRDNAGTLEFKNNAGLWQSFAIPAPTGGGWTRSGTTVQPTTGTDNVLVGNLDRVIHSSVQSGADAGARISTAIGLLTSTGGQVDAQGDLGGTISSTVTFGKPIHLVLGAGSYTLNTSSGPAITMYPGSIIEGQGKGITIIKVSANGVNADGITPAAHTIIKNLTIQGNTTASAGATALDGCDCADVTLDNVEISNFGGHAINLGAGGSSNWKIINSYIHDNHDDGILLGSTTSGNLIKGNRFENNGSNGIDVNGTDNRIQDNDVIGNGFQYSGTDCYGILVTSVGSAANGDDNLIEGNRVRNNKCQQVILRADNSGHSNHTIIKGNMISSNVAAGGSGVGINIDTSVGGACGTVNYTVIEGNVVYGNSAQGILIGGGAGTPCTADYTSVQNNTVTGNTGMGIWIVYGNHATVKNNIVVGNTAGQVALVDAAHNLDICNFTDASSNLCTFGSGTLAVDTIQSASGVATALTSSGNTQFQLKSSAMSRGSFSQFLDAFGAWNFYDDIAATVRLKVDSGGSVNAMSGFTVGSGSNITKILTGVATLDFPNTLAQTHSDLTIAVTGAQDQDTCIVGTPGALAGSNQVFSCFVTAADTVAVRLNNYSAAAHDPGSGQFKVTLIRF